MKANSLITKKVVYKWELIIDGIDFARGHLAVAAVGPCTAVGPCCER